MLYLAITIWALLFGYGEVGGLSVPNHATNEILIRYSLPSAKRLLADSAAIERLNHRFGLVSEVSVLPVNSLPGNAKANTAVARQRWRLLRFATELDVESAVREYAQLQDIDWAQPNYLRQFVAEPSDSLFDRQWNLDAIDWSKVEPVDASHLVVAVIDSGLDYDHPDIASQVWINEGELNGRPGVDDDGNGYTDDLMGWDFTHAPSFAGFGDYLDRDADPMDESGHGTHVAGIIGAISDNGDGIVGIASSVRIMPLRAGFNIAAGGFLEDDDLAAAVVYAADNGADIVNMSWGDLEFSPLIRDVIRYASSRGCVLVAAAGNDGGEAVFYPAKLDETIAVGATAAGDRVPTFTNSGPSIDVAAPGVGVWSLAPHGAYAERTGTSMAAAHVSGVAALYLARNVGMNAAELRSALALNARDIGRSGWDIRTGAGIVTVSTTGLLPPVFQIDEPALDDLLTDSTRIILNVSEGSGSFDLSWRSIRASEWNRLFTGTPSQMGFEMTWDVSDLPTGRYELRARSLSHDLQDRVEVRVQRRAPRVTEATLIPILDGSAWDHLLEWKTDQPSGGAVIVEEVGVGLVRTMPVPALVHDHSLTLGGDLGYGEYQIGILPRSGSLKGEKTPAGVVDIELTEFPQWDSVLRAWGADGYILPLFSDFNGNGISELGRMVFDGASQYGQAVFSEVAADGLQEVHRSSRLFIPWNVHDLDNDGLSELMVVDAKRVRLLEARSTGRFPQEIMWEQGEVWGGEWGDLDGDGNAEIFLRSSSADLFRIFESAGANSISEVALITNPTEGTNELGERQLVVDLDGDGIQELLVGDGDGDLFTFGSPSNDNFRVSWMLKTDGDVDGRVIGGGADLDGDGRMEFVVAHLHRNPMRPDRQRWTVSVFQAAIDGNFVREWSVEVKGGKANGNGIATGDLNGDGLPELIVALVPDIYLISSTGVDEYQPVWHAAISDTRRPAVGDLGGTGDAAIAFNSKRGIEVRSVNSSPAELLAPVVLRGHAQTENGLALTWQPVSGARSYRLYRDGELLRSDLRVTEFFDDDVAAGNAYIYSVAAVDFGGAEGARSNEMTITARPPARVLSVTVVAPTQLAVQFAESMADLKTHQFEIAGIGQPTSVVLDRGDSRVVLGFESALPDSGTVELVMSAVRAADGTPLALGSARLLVELRPFRAVVQVVGAEVVSPYRVELQFDGGVFFEADTDSIFRFADERIQIQNVEVLGADRLALNLDSSTPFLARGETVQLVISGLPDANGNLISERVPLQISAADLSRVMVFPNPFQPHRGKLVFANMTATATVRIYDLSGQLVRTLVEDSRDGGLQWDGSNEQGNTIGSGIYLYTVSSGTESVRGKFAVITK